jgi:hypothetical protein
MTPGLLTAADRVAAWRIAVPRWFLERLDTRLGTASVVPLLKTNGQCYGSVSDCEDGPYAEFSRWIERSPKGMHVRVYQHTPETDQEFRSSTSADRGDTGILLREGIVPWNELANRSTVAACEIRHENREPQPGEQLALTV